MNKQSFATRLHHIWQRYTNDGCANNVSDNSDNNDISKLMRNVAVRMVNYQIQDMTIVATVVDDITDNCYVASPYANLVSYANEESYKLPIWQRRGSQVAIFGLSKWLHHIDIDRVQILQNFLFPTNIISAELQHISPQNIVQLRQQACQNLPQHALLIRSLNCQQHQPLINTLTADGWLPVVNRQVYLIQSLQEWQKAFAHSDSKRDQKLLSDDRYQLQRLYADTSSQSTHQQFIIAEQLYNQLYLHKYSTQNVQFTALYMQELVQAKLLDIYLLYDTLSQDYVGMVGITDCHDVMTVPMVGYDIERPQKQALYRRLIAFAMRYAVDKHLQTTDDIAKCLATPISDILAQLVDDNKVNDKAHNSSGNVDSGYPRQLHLSAGAPDFKRQRGAKPTLEYIYVYVNHLPKACRHTWQSISWLSRHYYGKLLQKYDL